MGLETATYIDGLNANNPVNATDGVGEGDDHLRLLKSTILNTFPNITGVVTAAHTELNQLDGVDISDASELTSGELADARLSSNVPLLDAATNTFTGALVAASYGGIDEANLLDKTATETVSGLWTFTAPAGIQMSSVQPEFRLYETDAALDTKLWGLFAASGVLRLGTRADDITYGSDALRILRTGTTVDEIELNATLFDFNGAGDISGAFTVGGALTAASYGGIAEANLLDKSANESISGNYTFQARLEMSQNAPQIRYTEEDAAADNGKWWLAVNSEQFLGSTLNDAESVSVNWLKVERTGTAIDEIELNATLLDFNGNTDISGTLDVGDAATFAADLALTGTRAIDATTRLNLTGATVSVGESGGSLGFYGAAGQAKATISGSRGGNAALAGLLAELDDLGLITDNSTA